MTCIIFFLIYTELSRVYNFVQVLMKDLMCTALSGDCMHLEFFVLLSETRARLVHTLLCLVFIVQHCIFFAALFSSIIPKEDAF